MSIVPRLLGPHFYYDVVRLARRGRSTVLRVGYILAMFAGLVFVLEDAPVSRPWTPNDFARVSERFAYTLFFIQNLAVMVMTPAYLGSAIAEEKERRTLELLFTTQLSDMEIILGKLTSRVIHLFGFVIAGLPILSLIQFWGGIDMALIAGNLVNTLLNIVTVGSVCILMSVLCKTVSGAVLGSYAIIAPLCFCCGAILHGFPFILAHPSQARGTLSLDDLGVLVILHFIPTLVCVGTAATCLRLPRGVELEPQVPLPIKPPVTPVVPEPVRERERVDALSVPYELPPVSNNALLWKERFLGGPALSPLLAVPGILLLVVMTALPVSYVVVHIQLSKEGAVKECGVVLRFFYFVFLGCYTLGVAYRATGSVVRENQQQTLEPLLLLPIERSAILRAKWLGSLMRGWPWLGFIFLDIAIGTLIGAYHPFSAVFLCLTPWPMIFFFASLGLFISVMMRTVLRANIVLMLIVVLFLACARPNRFAPGPVSYLDTILFSAWDTDMQTRHAFLIGNIVEIAAYIFAAWILWMLAKLWFDKPDFQPPA